MSVCVLVLLGRLVMFERDLDNGHRHSASILHGSLVLER